jgi:uncharacterized protein (DUF2252 family)
MPELTAEAPPRRALRYQLDTALAGMTPADRAARGKAARASVPRASHAVFDPGPARPDPVALLEEQAKSRVPELVPVRWGRMMVSPFTYYRGAALPMASDLAATPVTGLAVQACGDAHLSNFGIFGSAERRLVFDVNDFDETLPGPWEWDVKRLAASLEVAARENGFPAKQRRDIVTAAVASYRLAMRDFAGQSNLAVWYARTDVEQLRADLDSQLTTRQRKQFDQGIAKARTRDSMQTVAKLTRMVDGRPRILSDPPLLVPITELIPGDTDRAAFESDLAGLVAQYRRTLETDRRSLLEQFEVCDMARKVVGVGSVGTRCWIILMLGRDADDPLFLQVKEAEKSVLSRFAGASKYTNQGQRVVAGQRLMQATSDIFLGWQRTAAGLDGRARDFYVRQLRDWKFAMDIATMLPAGMRAYGEVCGWTLARAHARSGDRIAIAAYLGGTDTFDRAVAQFAAVYADQNERDYRSLLDAAASGRIIAEHGL